MRRLKYLDRLDMPLTGRKRTKAGVKIWAVVMALALTVSGEVQAQETRVTLEVSHKHVGDTAAGTGCYSKEVSHVHIGNPSDGGACYGMPVYHLHTGDEENGGGCFAEEVHHVHTGNETDGGACYESEVYHVHEGNERNGGACYETPVYHVHEGDEEKGGVCYETRIYHEHSGSAVQGNGCYGEKVYHKHAGSESAGGACYGAAVYHRHAGNSKTGGGCYGSVKYHEHIMSASDGTTCYNQPVYHIHTDSSATGTSCYAPVYHQHTDACYTEAECAVQYIANMQVEQVKNEYCYHHGDVEHICFVAEYEHQSCGMGRTNESYSVCRVCDNKDKKHTYKKLICGKDETTIEDYQLACGKNENTVETWNLGCGKDETTVEGYELNCGKSEQTIDSYRRNCGKTEQTVESYKLNCGKTEKVVEGYRKSCRKTEADVDAYKQSCGKSEETIEGYALSCEKTSDTIDAYERNCGKDENFIDAYALSCNKTESSVDGYTLGCGRNEETFYGELALWNTTPDWTRKTVLLNASYVEKESFLQPKEEKFRWEGAEITGRTGESAEVERNGVYRVQLLTDNAEIAAQELAVSIKVENIDRTAPAICQIVKQTTEGETETEIHVIAEDLQPDGSQGSGLAAEAYSFDGGVTWSGNNVLTVTENGKLDIAVRDYCGNVTEESVEITDMGEVDEDTSEDDESEENRASEDDDKDSEEGDDVEDDSVPGDESTPEDSEEPGDDSVPGDSEKPGDESIPGDSEESGDESISGDDEEPGDDSTSGDTDDTGENQEESPVVIREMPKEKISRETTEVKPEVLLAEPVEEAQKTVLTKAGVVEVVTKAVVFTVSSVALAAVLLYLVYMLCRSVRVYHQDGEGGSRYAGSCIMKRTKDGFEMRIPEMILEQSATGEFILRPGTVFSKRHKGEELLVMAGKKKEAVWIDNEIPLRVSAYA